LSSWCSDGERESEQASERTSKREIASEREGEGHAKGEGKRRERETHTHVRRERERESEHVCVSVFSRARAITRGRSSASSLTGEVCSKENADLISRHLQIKAIHLQMMYADYVDTHEMQ